MKKIIGAILAFAGVFLLFALPVFAEDSGENTYTPPALSFYEEEMTPPMQTETEQTELTAQSPENDRSEDTPTAQTAENDPQTGTPSGKGSENEAVPSGGNAEDETAADAQNGETVFSALYRLLCEHAGEIFSTLAFLASLLVAFAYKRGLIPLLNSGISALTGAATRIGEAADGSRKSAEERYARVAERLAGAEQQLRAGTAALESLSERLRALEQSPDSTSALGEVLAEQVQMLAEIFQSTSLPQFRKDEIARRALAMKEVAAAFAREATRETEESA